VAARIVDNLTEYRLGEAHPIAAHLQRFVRRTLRPTIASDLITPQMWR
jgi:hypothetical protein